MAGMSTPTPATPAPAAPATPPAPQPITHRAAFDELLRRRIYALVAAAPDASNGDARRDALSDVQLLEAQAREFADAVDRDGRNIDYADAVFITGSQRPLIVTKTEWEHTPFYWQAIAGEVDSVTLGAELVGKLAGE